jgi:hypothetical protein
LVFSTSPRAAASLIWLVLSLGCAIRISAGGTNFSMRYSGNTTGAIRPDGRQRSYALNSVE